MDDQPKIAVSAGDINGIGPEIIFKAIRQGDFAKSVDFTIFGPEKFLRGQAGRLPLSFVDTGPAGLEPQYGEITAQAGEAAVLALESAVEATAQREFDALVTAPLCKEAIQLAGYKFPGQTELLKHMFNTDDVVMMFLSEFLIVGLVTTHIPLKRAPESITIESILSKLRIMKKELQGRLKIPCPVFAMCALNPHAGEDGLFGDEEQQILRPAAEAANEEGIWLYGPFPADSLFIKANDYNAVLAMYHDQATIPAKLQPEGSVNYTGGLPIIRVSPDHGAAFDIAGQGTANPRGMIYAIEWALRLCEKA